MPVSSLEDRGGCSPYVAAFFPLAEELGIAEPVSEGADVRLLTPREEPRSGRYLRFPRGRSR